MIIRIVAIAACMLLVAALPASGEPASYDDLQGATLEASWTEDMTVRRLDAQDFRTFRSPRQLTLTFGPGDAIKHQIVRTASSNSRTENRQLELNKMQPSSIGHVHWTFENSMLVYVETMFSGARRLIVNISRDKGGLSCAISAGVAREDNKPIVTLGLDNVTKMEIKAVEAIGGQCKISKP